MFNFVAFINVMIAVAGLELVAEFPKSIKCDEGYTYQNAKCLRVLRESPRYRCPDKFFLADNKCNQSVKPRYLCPDGMILTDGYCQKTVTSPCQYQCPPAEHGWMARGIGSGDARMAFAGSCVREVPTAKVPYCELGEYLDKTCVITTTQEPIRSCSKPSAILDNDECLDLTLSTDCNKLQLLNLRALAPATGAASSSCIRVESEPSIITCPSGFMKSSSSAQRSTAKDEYADDLSAGGAPIPQYSCVHREYRAPKYRCHGSTGVLASANSSTCVDIEVVPMEARCEEPDWSQKWIYGICTCFKPLKLKPTIECPVDGVYNESLGTCIRENSIRFDCPSSYHLRNTICEKTLIQPARLVFNITVACSAANDHNCSTSDEYALHQLTPPQ